MKPEVFIVFHNMIKASIASKREERRKKRVMIERERYFNKKKNLNKKKKKEENQRNNIKGRDNTNQHILLPRIVLDEF